MSSIPSDDPSPEYGTSREASNWPTQLDPPLADSQRNLNLDEGDEMVPAISSADLAKLIEAQIIPRLMLAHQDNGGFIHFNERKKSVQIQPGAADFPNLREQQPISSAQRFGDDDVAKLAVVLVEEDFDKAYAHIEEIRTRGISLETIYLDLLAPTARHLGSLWDDDRAFFSDVAVGLSRLHQLVREYRDIFAQEQVARPPGRCALILPMPDETHTFGLVLVVEFFRRAGWYVGGWPLQVDHDPLSLVKEQNYDIVGLSVSLEKSVALLPELIANIRKFSRNKLVKIMVGGQIFIQKPELIVLSGADGWAKDGAQSVELAQELVKSVSSI